MVNTDEEDPKTLKDLSHFNLSNELLAYIKDKLNKKDQALNKEQEKGKHQESPCSHEGKGTNEVDIGSCQTPHVPLIGSFNVPQDDKPAFPELH